MIYNLNSEADSEITQYSTSCCARPLIFGDKPKCKHRPLLCVPARSCWAWRNPPSPRRASGVGPSRPPLDSQDARSKGSDLSRSGRRDAPGAGSEERPACEARRSVGVSALLECSTYEMEQRKFASRSCWFFRTAWHSTAGAMRIALCLLKEVYLFVCFCFVFFSSPDAPDSFLHTGPLNPRKKKVLPLLCKLLNWVTRNQRPCLLRLRYCLVLLQLRGEEGFGGILKEPRHLWRNQVQVCFFFWFLFADYFDYFKR